MQLCRHSPPFARRGGCGQRRRVECHRHRLCPAPRAAGVASLAAAACFPLHQVWPTVRGLETQRPLFHMCARPQPLVMTPDVLLFLTERNDRPDVPLRAPRPPRPRGSAGGHSDASASSLERGPCFLAQGLVTSQPSDSDVRGARPPCGHTARTLTRIREDPPLPSSAHALAPGAGAWPEPLPPRTSAPHGLSLRPVPACPSCAAWEGTARGLQSGRGPCPRQAFQLRPLSREVRRARPLPSCLLSVRFRPAAPPERRLPRRAPDPVPAAPRVSWGPARPP